MISDKRVDFFIVGGQRSGTTWLANSLAQHPRVTLAKGKETHQFDSTTGNAVTTLDSFFDEYFSHADRTDYLLDASPSYLFLPGSIQAIAEHNPNARVIAILRDPGQRAISHYYHSRWLGQETRSLLCALALERRRMKNARGSEPCKVEDLLAFSYLSRGRFAEQVMTLFKFFPSALFIPFRLIKENPLQVLQRCQEFLGLEKLDLALLEPQNSHFSRPRHPFTAAILSLLSARDTNWVCRLLAWRASDFRE